MRVALAVVLTLVLAAAGSAQQSGEWYQGKPIRDIVFSGLKHVSASELEGVVEPFIGRPFNDEVFWEIQGRLYALEYFDLISPNAVPADALGTEVIIRFTVTERPIVSRINFSGNSSVRRNELLDVVTLKVNDVVTQVKLRVDELAVINKYLEKGFPDVSVRSETQTGANGTIVVTFYITEGERITLDDFRFEGNAVFSARTLRGQLSLKAKGIINDGAFQEAKLIADREALTQYYHDRGYVDAAVLDVVRDIQKDEKGSNVMTITFRLYEGRRYTFGGVSFEGNQIFPSEQLATLIYSKPGDTVNAKKLEADLQRVADLYYENGYIFNSINRVEQRDPETGALSYNIVIVERGRAHIENIIVRGNKKTKTEVILREIPLESGDVFSKTKVMDALRNLYNLQYFSMVAPDTPPGSEDSLMDLVFSVEEQPTTDIQFGLTFSGTADPDAFPISAMFRLNDRNFLGYGNSVGGEINASPDTQTLSLEYTHRWVFGLPLSAGFDFTTQHTRRYAAQNWTHWWFNGDEEYAFPDGFASREEYNDASYQPSQEYLMPYDQWRLSLGVSSGYRWSTFLGNLQLGGGVRGGIIQSYYDEDLYRPFDPVLRAEKNKWTPATSFWTSVSLDQRDIYYDPARGYYGIQRFGWYGIFDVEQEHYLKTDTKAEWFVTLLNLPVTDKYNFRVVFGIHSGLSLIFPQFGRGEKPTIERANMLSVDGMFYGRGWYGEYATKGYLLWENWAELRIPVVPGILAWDFFFDAAGVDQPEGSYFNGFTIDNMRFSFGGGLRFTIPQFPFRFSFAKRFKTENGEIRWQGGELWRNSSDPTSGLSFVMSFAISSY
jgi:outer membrane protein insertion porin family